MATQTNPDGFISFTTPEELANPEKDAERARNLAARKRELEQYVATHLDPELAKYVSVTNLIPYQSYAGFPAGWALQGATGTASGGIATVTGTGATSGVGIYTAPGYRFQGNGGHRYYVRAEMTAASTSATGISVSLTNGAHTEYVGGQQVAVTNPTPGQRYVISGIILAPAGWTGGADVALYQQVFHTAGTSAGAQVTHRPVTVIDLTEAYGSGREPSVEYIDAKLAARPGATISGTELRFDLRDAPTPDPESATGDPATSSLVAIAGNSQDWRSKTKIYQGASTAASTSYFHWANAYLGQSMTEHGNFAVSGKRMDEVLVEQLPQVLALDPAPGWCILGHPLDNDVIQGRTASQIISDMRAFYDRLEDAGIGVIAGTSGPQTGLTATQRAVLYEVVRWIKSQAGTRKRFILVDWYAEVADSAGLPATGMIVDNVHNSVAGAMKKGWLLAERVRAFIPQVDVLPLPGDPSNARPNPFKDEPGLGYGPDGLQTDTVPYNYRFASADATTLTGSSRIVDRTDGIPGKLVALKVVSGNARLTNASLIPAAAGQRWQAVVELFVDPEVIEAGVTKLSLALFQSGGSPIKNATYLDNDPDVDDGYGVTIPLKPGRMVYRTPPVVLETGTAGIYSHLRVSGTTGAGEIKVGRQGEMQVA